MKHVTLWVILLILWIAGASYCYVCNIQKDCGCDEPIYAIPGLIIQDGDFSASDDNNLYFGYGNSDLVVPHCIKRDLKGLVYYLNENKSRQLVLIGMYDSDENGNATLGLTRADSLRVFLIGLGADANQISISFKQNNELTFDPENTRSYGAMDYNFSSLLDCTTDLSEDELLDLIARLKTPQQIYYESGSSIMDYTPDMHKYISDLSYYLCKYPDSKISVIGHTDSIGEREMNLQLSIDRANNLKAYLLSKNISEEAIELDGKGPDDPIADNDTEEGRAMNRRVEIKLI
ncbi:MAG: OmpA family protein [Bacteroidota bacterium]